MVCDIPYQMISPYSTKLLLVHLWCCFQGFTLFNLALENKGLRTDDSKAWRGSGRGGCKSFSEAGTQGVHGVKSPGVRRDYERTYRVLMACLKIWTWSPKPWGSTWRVWTSRVTPVALCFRKMAFWFSPWPGYLAFRRIALDSECIESLPCVHLAESLVLGTTAGNKGWASGDQGDVWHTLCLQGHDIPNKRQPKNANNLLSLRVTQFKEGRAEPVWGL
jgi:hypothetical protein